MAQDNVINNEQRNYISSILPFWESLTNFEKEVIFRNIIRNDIYKGTQLLSGSNECSGLLIVRSGQIRAFIVSDEGREITLYRLKANDVCIMSASCMIKNINFTIYLEVEKSGEMFVLPTRLYKQIDDKNIQVKEFSMHVMSDKFSLVMNTVDKVFFSGIPQRISNFLLDQYEINQDKKLYYTHDDIAKNIGTVREVVSRTLKDFENKGVVKLSRGMVEILDVDKLHLF